MLESKIRPKNCLQHPKNDPDSADLLFTTPVTLATPDSPWIRILNRRIANVHVKEFSRKKRDQEGLWKGFDVELWEGDCDWPAVMKALDDVNYHGWLIAEIPGGNQERLAKIARLMDRMIDCP